MVNKFNIRWQLVRVKAKKIKDVENKIEFVLNFLKKNNSKENFGRIINWLKMARLGYKDTNKRQLFIDALDLAEKIKCDVRDKVNDLSLIISDDLLMVYRDLNKRKYGFQYKSIPKSHIEFVTKLKAELIKREVLV
tara:strand:- start:4833 stop:5240 length:408 start_codon:yes stop_codon:yes gene_type:complete